MGGSYLKIKTKHQRIHPKNRVFSNFEYYMTLDSILIAIVKIYFPTGLGAITQSTVTLRSPSFMATPSTFILYGDTGGGPPVEYTWTRNGVVITNNSFYSVSIWINRGRFRFVTNYVLSNALYRSKLIVTGVLPGVYQYSVNNRATPTSVDSDINIEGLNLPYFDIVNCCG